MSADVLYLAALKAAAAGDHETARTALRMLEDPAELAALLAPRDGGAGRKPETFRGEPRVR
jgi:hypothetical protein